MGSLNVTRIQLQNKVGFRIVAQSWCWSIEHQLFVKKAAWLDCPEQDRMNCLSPASQPGGAVSNLLMIPEAPRRAVSIFELFHSASSNPVVSLIQKPMD